MSSVADRLWTLGRTPETLGRKDAILYHHLILRSRLRLGPLSNPFQLAFFYWPLSLGIFWVSWYRRTTSSVLQHLDQPYATKWVSPTLCVWIPGLKMYSAYRLGQLVLNMEVQNRYRATSPVLAGIFALFPPLAILYLQNAVNRHWRLHAAQFATKPDLEAHPQTEK